MRPDPAPAAHGWVPDFELGPGGDRGRAVGAVDRVVVEGGSGSGSHLVTRWRWRWRWQWTVAVAVHVALTRAVRGNPPHQRRFLPQALAQTALGRPLLLAGSHSQTRLGTAVSMPQAPKHIPFCLLSALLLSSVHRFTMQAGQSFGSYGLWLQSVPPLSTIVCRRAGGSRAGCASGWLP